MSTCCGPRPGRPALRIVAPALLLALIPKCPMCVAAWIAAATGVGISAGAAGWLRTSAVAACVGLIVVKTVQIVRSRLSVWFW